MNLENVQLNKELKKYYYTSGKLKLITVRLTGPDQINIFQLCHRNLF